MQRPKIAFARREGLNQKLLIALVIGVIAWQAWGAYQSRTSGEEFSDDSESSVTAQLLDQDAASDVHSPYQCDGRTHCSEMTSCKEAEFFLANCPGVKMDGGRRRGALREAMVRRQVAHTQNGKTFRY